jgi:Na+/melibiose symporter-like transporter
MKKNSVYSKTFMVAYLVIMTAMCLTLACIMFYLSYQRGNDGTCNALAIIVLSVNGLVLAYILPSCLAIDNDLTNDEIYSAYRRLKRSELKKHLQSVDCLN